MFTRKFLNAGFPDFTYTVKEGEQFRQKSLSPAFYSSAGWTYEPRPGTPVPVMPRNVWLTNDFNKGYASLTNQSDQLHRVDDWGEFLKILETKGLKWW